MKEEASKFMFWTKTVEDMRRRIEKLQKSEDGDEEAAFEPGSILNKIEEFRKTLKE
jgi:hypothetical protein